MYTQLIACAHTHIHVYYTKSTLFLHKIIEGGVYTQYTGSSGVNL